MAHNRFALILALCSGFAVNCSGVDLEAERRAVLAADRTFAQASRSGRVDAWVEAFAADGIMFPQRGRATGHDQIRSIMEPQFDVIGLELTWEPTTAVVAAAADYAYTIGNWTLTNDNPVTGTGVAGTGNYVTIWRKEDDGSWKVMANIGNLDFPPGMTIDDLSRPDRRRTP